MAWLFPDHLWMLVTIPAMVLLFLWAAWRRREALKRFGDLPLIARLSTALSSRRRRWKATLVVLGCSLLVVALAGPRFGSQLREIKREGVDLVIALDVSLSMQAEDVLPSRLAKAKFEIGKMLEVLTGDRVGLVTFAGDAFVQCPLTLDYSALQLFLDVADPSMIPTPGTDFQAALEKAIGIFEGSSNTEEADGEERTRVVLIVSDGENHVADIESVIGEARNRGIVLFAAGVGETAGTPIPLYRGNRRTGFKKDADGQVVSTRLEEAALQEMAQNGSYFRISRTTSTLPEVKTALERLERTELASEMFEEYDEKYQWPLALGLLLLLAERMIREKRKERRTYFSMKQAPS